MVTHYNFFTFYVSSSNQVSVEMKSHHIILASEDDICDFKKSPDLYTLIL